MISATTGRDLNIVSVVGINLRRARERKTMTVLDVANQIKLSPTTLSKYEVGHAMPPADRFIQLARLYGVSLAWLAGEEPAR